MRILKLHIGILNMHNVQMTLSIHDSCKYKHTHEHTCRQVYVPKYVHIKHYHLLVIVPKLTYLH